jgi:ABC-type phosphate transport system substrate-binding protein
MKISHSLSLALLACAFSTVAFADGVVVIVNKSNTNPVDKGLVAKIYTGESRIWDGGGSITAYDLPEDNLLREDFDGAIVGKSEAALKKLWGQNVVTGKALPPKVAASDEDVKRAVAANKNAIGYIQASKLDDSVKVALR